MSLSDRLSKVGKKKQKQPADVEQTPARPSANAPAPAQGLPIWKGPAVDSATSTPVDETHNTGELAGTAPDQDAAPLPPLTLNQIKPIFDPPPVEAEVDTDAPPQLAPVFDAPPIAAGVDTDPAPEPSPVFDASPEEVPVRPAPDFSTPTRITIVERRDSFDPDALYQDMRSADEHADVLGTGTSSQSTIEEASESTSVADTDATMDQPSSLTEADSWNRLFTNADDVPAATETHHSDGADELSTGRSDSNSPIEDIAETTTADSRDDETRQSLAEPLPVDHETAREAEDTLEDTEPPPVDDLVQDDDHTTTQDTEPAPVDDLVQDDDTTTTETEDTDPAPVDDLVQDDDHTTTQDTEPPPVDDLVQDDDHTTTQDTDPAPVDDLVEDDDTTTTETEDTDPAPVDDLVENDDTTTETDRDDAPASKTSGAVDDTVAATEWDDLDNAPFDWTELTSKVDNEPARTLESLAEPLPVDDLVEDDDTTITETEDTDPAPVDDLVENDDTTTETDRDDAPASKTSGAVDDTVAATEWDDLDNAPFDWTELTSKVDNEPARTLESLAEPLPIDDDHTTTEDTEPAPVDDDHTTTETEDTDPAPVDDHTTTETEDTDPAPVDDLVENDDTTTETEDTLDNAEPSRDEVLTDDHPLAPAVVLENLIAQAESVHEATLEPIDPIEPPQANTPLPTVDPIEPPQANTPLPTVDPIEPPQANTPLPTVDESASEEASTSVSDDTTASTDVSAQPLHEVDDALIAPPPIDETLTPEPTSEISGPAPVEPIPILTQDSLDDIPDAPPVYTGDYREAVETMLSRQAHGDDSTKSPSPTVEAGAHARDSFGPIDAEQSTTTHVGSIQAHPDSEAETATDGVPAAEVDTEEEDHRFFTTVDEAANEDLEKLEGRTRRRFSWSDRRKHRKAKKVAAEVVEVPEICPHCGAAARADIVDNSRGIRHMSCDTCFKMWQETAV